MTDRAVSGVPSFSDQADADTATDAYASRFSGPVGEWFLEVQRRIVLDLLAPWPHASVLDLGGGHAQIAGSLVEAGYRVMVAGSRETCRARLDRTLNAREQQRLAQLLRKLLMSLEPTRASAAASRAVGSPSLPREDVPREDVPGLRFRFDLAQSIGCRSHEPKP